MKENLKLFALMAGAVLLGNFIGNGIAGVAAHLGAKIHGKTPSGEEASK